MFVRQQDDITVLSINFVSYLQPIITWRRLDDCHVTMIKLA